MTVKQNIINALSQHPVYLVALGIPPLIMKSDSLLSGLTIGMAYTLIFLLSCISVSIIRKFIPHQGHLVFILIITSSWTTVVDLLMQAWLYEMRVPMDIYIPIIAMNSLLIVVLQQEALRNSITGIFSSLLHTIFLVVGICALCGAVREMLAHGMILTDIALLLPTVSAAGYQVLPDLMILPLFNKVSGAFLVLGCAIALLNLLMHRTTNTFTSNSDQGQ